MPIGTKKHQRITIKTFNKGEMIMDTLTALLQDTQYQQLSEEDIVISLSYSSVQSPEEILIAKEKNYKIVEMAEYVLSKLTPSERKVFVMYCFYRCTFDVIGKSIIGNASQLIKNFSRRKSKKIEEKERINYVSITQQELKKITRKISKIMKENDKLSTTCIYHLCKELLMPPESTEEISTPQHEIGWLSDMYMKMNNGGHWKYDKGRNQNIYKSDSKCVMDTYTTAICSQCGGKCTNPVMQERRLIFVSKTVT